RAREGDRQAEHPGGLLGEGDPGLAEGGHHRTPYRLRQLGGELPAADVVRSARILRRGQRERHALERGGRHRRRLGRGDARGGKKPEDECPHRRQSNREAVRPARDFRTAATRKLTVISWGVEGGASSPLWRRRRRRIEELREDRKAVSSSRSSRSNVEVERELRRGGPQPHRVQLLLDLVLDPGLDHVLGEDVALEQELVVLLQLAQGLLEGARHLRNVLQLLGGKSVDVLVERVAW